MADKDTDSGLVQVDTYSQRKNYAKGLVDLSLLTSNAHQLSKIYFEAGEFNFACFLLVLSILLQVSVKLKFILCHSRICLLYSPE